MTIEALIETPLPLLEVGKRYLVIKPAHSFGEIDGELVNFEETRTEIEVLAKPETVIVCDGETEVEEPLPAHLTQQDWYSVRKIKSGVCFWLNTKGCRVIQL